MRFAPGFSAKSCLSWFWEAWARHCWYPPDSQILKEHLILVTLICSGEEPVPLRLHRELHCLAEAALSQGKFRSSKLCSGEGHLAEGVLQCFDFVLLKILTAPLCAQVKLLLQG